MSLEIIKEITLDIDNPQSIPEIEVKSGNNLTDIIMVSINKNSNIFDLTGKKVRYCILRADMTQNLSDAVIEENKIKIALSYNDLAVPGRISCEIILSENEQILFTKDIYIRVLPNVLDEQKAELSNEYSSLINVINKATEITDSLNDLEKEVSNNEASRLTKENIRQENELQRIENFKNIKTDFQNMTQENLNQLEEVKKQSQYAKTQGDYAKEQTDKLINTDVSSLKIEIDDINNQIDDLQGYIGYSDNDIYGVEVDFKNNIFTRLAGAVGKTHGKDFDSINAFNRRRCILDDSGNVVAYYGEQEYVEDGSKGQVMVEQPKFYYKVVPLELSRIENRNGYHMKKARYYICDTPKQGFKLHPAFIQDGVEKDKIYLSAYECSIYDTSASAYLKLDEQIADFNTDKLSSIVDAKPCSGTSQKLTRENARKLANNRGNGWNLSTIQSVSCTQLLYLIEYSNFNSQHEIGQGITTKPLSTGNQSEHTGLTSSLGNSTGVGTNNSISYRGEENFYGNIWTWVDGINIYNYGKGEIFIADHDFGDEGSLSSYAKVEFELTKQDGYISSFGYDKDFDFLFIPTETIGNSTIPVGDYIYQNNGLSKYTPIMLGGSWQIADKAGFYSYHFAYQTQDRVIGARLCFIPQ